MKCNMKRIICVSLLAWIGNLGAFGQVSFSENIAQIIYDNCSTCHRPGEIGPMSLTNYDEIKNWAPTIKYVTSIGYMPPWQADPEYRHFLGESTLTQEEINLIAQWADAGAPQGDESLEPDFPDFPEGSLLGEPDLVLTMEQAHVHQGNNRDSYMYFVLPTGLAQDRVVKAVEFRPGNSKIVHHALIFEDTKGIAAATDAMTPEYGFESFGGFGGNNDGLGILEQKQYPGYVPGQKSLFYPDGIGQTLAAGADIAVQIHYAPVSSSESDQSSLNIFFADEEETINRHVDGRIMLPLDLPPFGIAGFLSFRIPANTVREFEGIWEVEDDLSFMGISPHMHLLGADWEVFLEHTDGSITNLIKIPEWDFNWQGNYYFDRYIKAEKGSIVHAKATYDNTAENPNQPSSPPQTVAWGEGTKDEMYYLPILHVPYQEGDENIVFSTNTVDIFNEGNNSMLPISPNPVSGMVNVQFNIDHGGPINIQLYNVDGQLCRTLKSGEFYNRGDHFVHFQADHLDSGMYFIKIDGKKFSLIQKFIKG